MDTSTPSWVAVVIAVIALLGVLAAQSITLYNESKRRRDEQANVVRADVQAVMIVFFEFAEFARTNWPSKDSSDVCEVYEEEWDRVAGPLAAGAANMAGRGKHRYAALALMDGLGSLSRAYDIGESAWQPPRTGYIQMSWAGFEIIAAWLRGERIPRHPWRVARAAVRMRARLEAEYAHRALNEERAHRSGVLRRAFRAVYRWVEKQWRKLITKPLSRIWRFLFAP